MVLSKVYQSDHVDWFLEETCHLTRQSWLLKLETRSRLPLCSDWAGSRSRASSQIVPVGCQLGLENLTLKKCLVLISLIHSYYTQKVDIDHTPLSCIIVLLPSCRPIHHATMVYLMWKNGPFLSKKDPTIKYQNSNSRCQHSTCCY